jgi:flagellar basal-body rod modification protein FlgD
MPVSSATSSPSIAALTANPANAATARVTKRTLGQEDFLKLITVQLSSQDPLKPMEDTAFIAQMAQFSSLEQSSQLAREFSVLRSLNELNSAGSMLGRQVTVKSGEDQTLTGVVQAIDSSGATPRLLIDGKLYPASAVTRVELFAPTEPRPAA